MSLLIRMTRMAEGAKLFAMRGKRLACAARLARSATKLANSTPVYQVAFAGTATVHQRGQWLGRQTVDEMVAGFRAIQPHLDHAVLGTHSNPAGVRQVLKTLRGAGSDAHGSAPDR